MIVQTTLNDQVVFLSSSNMEEVVGLQSLHDFKGFR